MSINRFLTILVLLALLVYAVTGIYSRPLADDRLFVYLAGQYGALGAIEQQYLHWHGRLGYSAMMTLETAAPIPIIRVFPAVMIILAVGVLYGLLKRFVEHPLLAAAGVTLAFLLALPNVWQTIYWYGGSTNYPFPLILIGGALLWHLQQD